MSVVTKRKHLFGIVVPPALNLIKGIGHTGMGSHSAIKKKTITLENYDE